MSAKRQLDDLHRLYKEIEDQRKGIAMAAFNELLPQLFSSNNSLDNFSFYQYTPGFNDGDPCVFSAHTDINSISVNGERGDEILGSDHEYVTVKCGPRVSDTKYERVDKPQSEWSPLIPLVQPVADFLANFDDRDFEAMFGDHCEVTVSREGVEVSSYEHD